MVMSVLAGLFARAEGGRPSDGTYRFEVVLDSSETQVICFDELVEKQRRTSEASMLDASAANSKASEPDSDKGSCYDSEDSFLDDDELVAELEPSNMKSKIGGFFINTGAMDAEEDPEYGKQVDDHYGSGGGAGGGKKKNQKSSDNKETKKKARDTSADYGDNAKRQKLSGSPGVVVAPSPAPAATPASVGDVLPSGGDPTAGNGLPVAADASPRGGSGRTSDGKHKKKKGAPLPKIHDGILARIEDLRLLVESRDSQTDGKCSSRCPS